MAERNPVIITERISSTPKCPKCGSEKFSGRRIQGTAVFKCQNTECLNEWSGGFGMSPAVADPRVPVAPEVYTPPLRLNIEPRTGQVEEIRKKVDPTPDFRKGALIPPEGEEDV